MSPRAQRTDARGVTTSETFGATLRRLRQERRVSLRRLSKLTFYDFGYLGQIERGERTGSGEVASRCDAALQAGGVLSDLFAREESSRASALVPKQRTSAHTATTLEDIPTPTLTSAINLGEDDMNRRGFLVNSAVVLGAAIAWPSGPEQVDAPQGRLLTLTGPGGRLFAGSAVPAMVLPAISDNQVLANIPQTLPSSYFLRRPERGLSPARSRATVATSSTP